MIGWKRMAQNIVNEKNKVMNRNKNWGFGDRIMGLKNKRVEFLLACKPHQEFIN